MKNLEPKTGYKNRHIDKLPVKECDIEIIYKDTEGEHPFLCRWKPSGATGYLGSATPMTGRYSGQAFKALERSNAEFVYFKEV